MSRLRVLHPVRLEDEHSLASYAASVRAIDGCVEAEAYRRPARPRLGVLVELWEDEAAFSSHWRSGTELPATTGPSELYLQRTFRREVGWVDDTRPDHGSAISWPGRGAVRVVINASSSDPETSLEGFAANEDSTRLEDGCIEFDWCQSLADPHHFCLVELWQDTSIYDQHWRGRLREAAENEARGVKPAPRPPYVRTLGSDSAEFYRAQPFVLEGGRWLPADPTLRSETVTWGD